MTMDVESPEENPMNMEEEKTDPVKDDIINSLINNDEIFFKNQQKWEPDLTVKEKFDIAIEIFETSKLNFLLKFGKYLKTDQLDYFEQFTSNSEPEWEEIKVCLNELHKNNLTHNTTVKNRRFEALKELVEGNSYFSEIEMMKRNPLLYEQLVGQYLTVQEVKERDRYAMDENSTFVKFLMEGIERGDAESYKRKQEDDEDNQMEEEDSNESSEEEIESNPVPSTSRWGEFEEDKVKLSRKKVKVNKITPEEQLMLKEEFISTMYQHFLDGKDKDFDYNKVDNDTSYDNMNEIDNDAEDKYFDSEEPEEAEEVNISEDELDIFMNSLSQHPAVSQLSKDLKKKL